MTLAAKSTPTARKVRRILRQNGGMLEGGWFKADPYDWKNNVAQLAAYLRTLPGGSKSAAFKIALREFKAVRERMIVYPEDWIMRSIELNPKQPL